MNETNIEKQLTRIADNLERLADIAERAERLAENVVACQRMGKHAPENKR